MRPIKRSRIGTSFAAMVFLVACASNPIPTTKYDADADFSQYQTFAWAEGKPINTDGVLRSVGTFVQDEIKQAVIDELAGKGIYQIENIEGADLTVVVTLGQRDEYEINNYLERVHVYAPRVRRVNSVAYITTGQAVEVYSEGSVSIDMIDNREGYPVWYGHISDEIKPAISATEAQARLRQAIELLLSDFPPNSDAS